MGFDGMKGTGLVDSLFSDDAIKRLLLQIQYVQQDHSTNSPIADPQNQKAANAFSFAHTSRVVWGTITDTTALANVYRVQFEKGVAPLPCMYAPRTTHSAYGIRELTTLQAGTSVLCVIHPHVHNGVIFAVIPPPNRTGKDTLEDVIAQAGRHRVDEAHKFPLRMDENGYIADMRAGRPFDTIMGGETGWIAETGGRIMIDSFMFQCAIDEMCGVFGFYHDQMLRVAGYNMQVWTAGYEREAQDDQGEYNDVEGWTPYPWEHMGLPSRGDPRVELTPEDQQFNKPWYSHWEPKEDAQQPHHRTRVFHGYLGQGSKQLVQGAPPSTVASPLTYGVDRDLQTPGLHEDNVGLDGARFIASAKRISITKRLGIISPKRHQRAEQPETGDEPSNYRHAGESSLGDGPEHKITGDLETPSDGSPLMSRAAGLLDMHAYLFNYAGVHPFVWHTQDWLTPEESALDHTGGYSVEAPDFTLLGSQMHLAEPEAIELDIDHRLAAQKFFKNQSAFELLEDGGVVIFDGFGSEFRMTGGEITISAPGDIWLKSGRNLMSWAGGDWITRARNAADLTVTEKDIRFKAEGNFQMLAGNGGKGAMLLESRATESISTWDECGEAVEGSGIILRAKNAGVVAHAADIYLRTRAGGSDARSGDIVFDAAVGTADIITHSRDFHSFMQNTRRHSFGVEDSITSGNEFSPVQTTLNGQLCVSEDVAIGAQLLVETGIAIARGHIASPTGGVVSSLTSLSVQKVRTRIRTCVSSADSSSAVGRAAYLAKLEQQWYQPGFAGHDKTIDNVEFGYRTEEEYKIPSDFMLYEDRWQQMARLTNKIPARWTEKPVLCHGEPHWPYPGKDMFTKDKFAQPASTLFEFTASQGRSKDRFGAPGELATAYSEPKYGDPTPVALDGNYPITSQ